MGFEFFAGYNACPPGIEVNRVVNVSEGFGVQEYGVVVDLKDMAVGFGNRLK